MKTRAALALAALLVALATALPARAGSAEAGKVPPPWAPDAVFVQAGRASETSTLTLGVQWDWRRHWQLGERTRVSGYSEVSEPVNEPLV
jgi:hypothetical protein